MILGVGGSVVPKIKGLKPEDPYEPPEDQETILNMLVQPQTFGQGLFDYSCHGNNWHISDKVVSGPSRTNILSSFSNTYKLIMNYDIARQTISHQYQPKRNDAV